MFAFALAVAFVVALSARLVTDIRQDRPFSPPRSHWHELDTTGASRGRQVA